jgi:hypothetical protein
LSVFDAVAHKKRKTWAFAAFILSTVWVVGGLTCLAPALERELNFGSGRELSYKS